MMRWGLILLPLLLAGCLDDELKTAGSQSHCYDIVPIADGPPGSPLLINKCSGETWMLLRTVHPKEKDEKIASYTYRWHLVASFGDENVIAGK